MGDLALLRQLHAERAERLAEQGLAPAAAACDRSDISDQRVSRGPVPTGPAFPPWLAHIPTHWPDGSPYSLDRPLPAPVPAKQPRLGS